MSCPVCIEKLTEKNKVVCHISACSYTCCKKCVQTYLLNTTLEPHCMNCRTKWNVEFIKTAIGKTFITLQYRAHRANVLANQIIAKKEEYLENAALYKENLADKEISTALNAEVTELRRAYEAKYAELDKIRSRIARRTSQIENRNNLATKEKRVKIFKMPCQNTGCHGMLDSSYFCILCAKKTCKDCLAVIEPNHVCNPDSIATAALIKSTSKPCPKCGERISKIDGCDQMWCVECKTAFSWNTGTIETGTVHNPHYYQWMRENGGMPRTDVPENCCNANGRLNMRKINLYYGRINEFYKCYERALQLKYMVNNPLINNITEIITPHINLFEKICLVYKNVTEYKSYIDHITQVIIPETTAALERRGENSVVIYEYLIGIKSRENLGISLVIKEENEIKVNATNDILNATQMVLTQILQTILNNIPEDHADLTSFINHVYNNNFNIEINNNEATFYYKKDCESNLIKLKKYYNLIQNNGLLPCINAANALLTISNEHIQAATKYLAYSNIEQIRLLHIHNSKRKLCLWNFENNTREEIGFKNNSEMQAAIEKYKAFL